MYASARMRGAKHPTYIIAWYRGYPADYILTVCSKLNQARSLRFESP
jgi:hypothetical protein